MHWVLSSRVSVCKSQMGARANVRLVMCRYLIRVYGVVN